MRVWLDDERPMPAGYDVHVRTAGGAIALLEAGGVAAMSFDNDLGAPPCGKEWVPTEGRHVAARLEELAFRGLIPRVECRVHTANPVARQAIASSIRNAERFWDGHEARGELVAQIRPETTHKPA